MGLLNVIRTQSSSEKTAFALSNKSTPVVDALSKVAGFSWYSVSSTENVDGMGWVIRAHINCISCCGDPALVICNNIYINKQIVYLAEFASCNTGFNVFLIQYLQ